MDQCTNINIIINISLIGNKSMKCLRKILPDFNGLDFCENNSSLQQEYK